MRHIILKILMFFSIASIYAQVDYEAFKGDKVKTALELKLRNVFFKEYGNEKIEKYEELFIKEKKLNNTTPENVIGSLYSVNNLKAYQALFKGKSFKISSSELENRELSDTLKNKIRFVHRLTFDHNNKPITFFKYKEIKDSITSITKLITLQKKDDVSWQILPTSDFPNIEYVIKKITTRAFWEFFNRTDDPDFPEINSLKSKVQDAKNILDIEKLAEIIRQNRTVLNKYLDQ